VERSLTKCVWGFTFGSGFFFIIQLLSGEFISTRRALKTSEFDKELAIEEYRIPLPSMKKFAKCLLK